MNPIIKQLLEEAWTKVEGPSQHVVDGVEYQDFREDLMNDMEPIFEAFAAAIIKKYVVGAVE